MVPTDQIHVPRSLYQTDSPIGSPPLLVFFSTCPTACLPSENPWEGPKPLLSNTSDTPCDHIGHSVTINLIHCLSYYGAVGLLDPTAVFCFVLS